MPVLGAAMLAAFIKLLFATDSPRFCAGLYTGLFAVGTVLLIAAGGIHPVAGVLDVVIVGVVSWGYFMALHRIDPWTGAWWGVAMGGPILAGLVVACIG